MLDLANFDIARFEASAAEAARLLRALANERRLMILCQLGDRERSVGELLPLVGLSQSALSQHLALLREEGIGHEPRVPDGSLSDRRQRRSPGGGDARRNLLPARHEVPQ